MRLQVTIYRYTGPTRREDGRHDTWEQEGEPVEYDDDEEHWSEAAGLPSDYSHGPFRIPGGNAYELSVDGLPTYRAEVRRV